MPGRGDRDAKVHLPRCGVAGLVVKDRRHGVFFSGINRSVGVQ